MYVDGAVLYVNDEHGVAYLLRFAHFKYVRMRERALWLTLVCWSASDVTMYGAPHFTSQAPRGSTSTGEAWAGNLSRKVLKEDASGFRKYASSLPEFPVRIERNPAFQTASPNKVGPGGLRGGEHTRE